MQIGSIELENPFVLAPLAGITDSSFRRVCKRYGCSLVFSEMISAKGLYYNDKSTEKLLKIYDDEKPIAYQIFGSEPEIMAFAAEKLADRENCLIDINMGCPVPKVVKNGDGSALLKDPKLIESIVKAVVKASSKPVTVKIRTGWDEKSINAVEAAKVIEASGASAITVHGRTREQYYSGKADWDMIKAVKDSVRIPVIGNGDIFSGEDAMKMMADTGCDGTMIARGALGNPWIFAECKALWQKGVKPSLPSLEDKINTIISQFEMAVTEKGEYAATREMRKHTGWYFKGMRYSAEIRRKVNEVNTRQEMLDLLSKYQESI